MGSLHLGNPCSASICICLGGRINTLDIVSERGRERMCVCVYACENMNMFMSDMVICTCK